MDDASSRKRGLDDRLQQTNAYTPSTKRSKISDRSGSYQSPGEQSSKPTKQLLKEKVDLAIDRHQPEGLSGDVREKSQSLRSAFAEHVWAEIRIDYDQMTQDLKKLLEITLGEESINAEVLGRTKTIHSTERTLQRREDHLFKKTGRGFDSLQQILNEMHDLSGLRIVLAYRDDLKRAQQLISTTFGIRKAFVQFDRNREIGQLWRKPWFGAYETQNHRVHLVQKDEAAFPQYVGVMFEIQLTTFADSLYNILAHDLLYKAEPGLLTSEDEMVIDLSHGLAKCFELCMRILKPKLDKDMDRKVDNRTDTKESLEMANMLGERQAREAQLAVTDFQRDLETLPNDTSIMAKLSQLITQQLRECFHEQQQTAEDRECLKDLRPSDPRDDKKRIEQTKGGLLKDSYKWILEHQDFKQWRDNNQSRLLWIKGDPGKGKTMLLCGIIDEMSPITTSDGRRSSLVISYFFCQATDSRINTATAVLRGLIYLLAEHQPSLLSHVRERYDKAGKALFEDANAWVALTEIMRGIIHDPHLDKGYLIIDALDECSDLQQLLKFIRESTGVSSRVKWIVSSRNWPEIEEAIGTITQQARLDLELNEDAISAAVQHYTKYKVEQLARKKDYGSKLQEDVYHFLTENSGSTFLWVALVYQELALPTVKPRHVRDKLRTLPPGLNPLYQEMLKRAYASEDSDICRHILVAVSLSFRPLTLPELACLIDLPDTIPEDDLETLEEIIGNCGSFLTLRDKTVYFVHQSAQDFLLQKGSKQIFPSGSAQEHQKILLRSIETMSQKLSRNIYNLQHSGILIDKVRRPQPDPLAAAAYSCVNWVDHLLETESNDYLQDEGKIDEFLREHYLYWLEALSLLRSIPEGAYALAKLKHKVQNQQNASFLLQLLQDMQRFLSYSQWAIENSPLQVYTSALIFSPNNSLTKQLFQKEEPAWIKTMPMIEDDWSPCLQTLEGHSSEVSSVAFSGDSQQIASGSYDATVRIWDTRTGQCLQTLEGHSSEVSSVAFSGDSQQIASGSHDTTVRIWDTRTGQCLQTLEGHSDWVLSVAFSGDSQRIASGSHDATVRIWDTRTGQCLQTLEGHSDWVSSVAFSGDSQQIASGSYDATVRIWDTGTGQCLQTLEVGQTLKNLSLDFTGAYLETEMGIFNLENPSSAATLQQVQAEDKARPPQRCSYGINSDGNWITSGAENLLWLPSEYRPVSSAVAGSSVAIGCSSGRVLCFSFRLLTAEYA